MGTPAKKGVSVNMDRFALCMKQFKRHARFASYLCGGFIVKVATKK
jgi:hypothetical protein